MHTHTNASDGKESLENLVPIAQKKNLDGFCVTDHDTTEAAKRAKSVSIPGIEIIPGIELSCKLDKRYLIEVIGYFINPFDKEKLKGCCDINKGFRDARMKMMIWKFNDIYKSELKNNAREMRYDHWEITWEDILLEGKDADSIGLNHLNKVFLKRKLYKDREAFETALNKNYSNNIYVEREAVGVDQALDAILSSGGVVGIPHPALVAMDYPDELTDDKFIEMIKPYFGKSILAMEAEYPYEKVRPECKKDLKYKSEKFAEIIKNNKLIPVNGSDGHQKPNGPTLGEKLTDRKEVNKIRSKSRAPVSY